MRNKKLIALVGITASLVFGALVVARMQTREAVRERPPDNQKLKWYAAKARSEGKTKYEFGGRTPFLTGVKDIEEALEIYSVVVAQVVGSHVAAVSDGDKINTWYKLRIIETLSEATRHFEAHGSGPPAELKPLNRGEFVVTVYGGSLVIDGVEVTERATQLKQGQRYLMFARLYPDGIADTNWTYGIFEIDPGERLLPYQANQAERTAFKDFVEKYGSTVEGVKAGMRKGGAR